MALPLRGVKVMELQGLAPAPFCGMVLCDFGASVIRVDKLDHDLDVDCLSSGKKSISVNMKNPKGVEILRALSKTSDVLIEPYRAGVMEKLGLGPHVLLKDNPRLIYARLTGFGQSGMLRRSAGHDLNYIALSGLLSLFGRRGEKPIFPANLIADFGGGGLMCAFGILVALFERTRSNLGQVVDNSMVEGTGYLGSWLCRSQHHPYWGNGRGQNVLDSGAHFYEVYETKDGKYMAVAALEPQFYANLLKGLGLSPDDVPQYADFEESKNVFQRVFATKTQDEWCTIFEPLDACVTPVLPLSEAPKHKHNSANNSFIKTDSGFAPKPTPNLSRTPAVSCSNLPPPKVGQHTKNVLLTLGYSPESIQEFEREGVIRCYKLNKL